MAEWTARVEVWYSQPGAAANSQLVAYHTFTLMFDCSCCVEREEPELDVERFGSSVADVRAIKSFASPLGFGEAMLAPDPDRFTGTVTEINVRAANCPEGRGLIVWVTARGEFNTNQNHPPFVWESYGAKGAWRICCCCDPFDCEPTYVVQNHRRATGGGSGGITVRVTTEENSSCDGALSPKEYEL